MATIQRSLTPKSVNASSGGGGGGNVFPVNHANPLTPTKRRVCPATTPKKRLVHNHPPSLSPPLLRTPPKTVSLCRQRSINGGGDVLCGTPTRNGNVSPFASRYSSDRFIPNRSALRVDICRASVESAERNLGRTFEKLSRRQASRRRERELGENGDPNDGNAGGGRSNSGSGASSDASSTPPHVPPPQAGAGASPSTVTPNANDESATPLQAEFHRRMRGALLNIPVEDAAGGRYPAGAGSSVNASSSGGDDGANRRRSAMTAASPSAGVMGSQNRENVESIVYASLNDDENSCEIGGSPHPPRRGMPRMLSFQGIRREDAGPATRSMSGSSHPSVGSSSGSLDDPVAATTSGLSTPMSTPKRRLGRQASAGSRNCPSPRRNVASPHLRRHASAPANAATIDPFSHDQLHVLHRAASNSNAIGSSNMTPFDSLSQAENRLRSATKSIGRRIPRTPSRILDAPELVDDYYLNLVSWSESNVLAVALGQCVYLWEAETGNIKHLLTLREETDFVTSVAWVKDRGNAHYIAVGTNHNVVQLWDAEAERRLRSLDGHTARVGALSWNQHWLSSGGRDSLIVQHDVRSRDHVVSTYAGHQQEVCGLRWNDEGSTLASGGNENLLCLWDAAMSRRGGNRGGGGRGGGAGHDSSNIGPRLALTQHKAAVKALAWCPFHRGLLASGGGTADRTIKFWNANSGAVLNSIDTGSQVCSLLWSKHQRELCSSHGFSENQLILWKYPTMTKIQEFKGHTARVLHMDQSPDGGCVVSAAADETLRFWDVFGSPPNERKGNNLAMGNFCGTPMIR